MNDHKREQRQQTKAITQKYRVSLGNKGHPLSFTSFATQINEYSTPPGSQISHQAVKNWVDGVHSPDYFFIARLAYNAPKGSWQHSFALEILLTYDNLLPATSEKKCD